MKRNRLIAISVLATYAAFALGCANSTVGNAQQAIASAKIGMDAFVHIERNNEAIIKAAAPGQYPAIHNAANLVRRNGPQALITADTAVDAYIASNSTANQTALNNALAVLSSLAASSTMYTSQINAFLGLPAPSPAPTATAKNGP
jgi:hypothetical protein